MVVYDYRAQEMGGLYVIFIVVMPLMIVTRPEDVKASLWPLSHSEKCK